MPYKIEGNAVVKKGSGKVVGHSKNPKAYMRALYANADKVTKHEKREGRKLE